MAASDPALSRGDILRRLVALEKEVRQLRAERRRDGSLGAGVVVQTNVGGTGEVKAGIQVLKDNGSLLAFIGRQDTIFGPVDAIKFYSLLGKELLTIQSNLFGFESVGFLDGQGNVTHSPEASTVGVPGQGVSRPYVNGTFETVATPTDTTASGTFTTLQKAIWVKQHKAIKAWVEVQVTATTGEIRWRINTGPDAGTIVHGPITKSGNTLDSYGPFEVPGGFLSEFEVELQARVASGAGLVRVRTQTAIGREP